MAGARTSLRPTLFLVRQKVNQNPKAVLGDALISVLVSHLNATILGSLEDFVEKAQAQLDDMLKRAGAKGQEILLSFAQGIEDLVNRTLHYKEPPTSDSTSLLKLIGSAITHAPGKAAVSALNSASGYIPEDIKRLALFNAGLLRQLAKEVNSQLAALADVNTEHSVGYLLSVLSKATKKKRRDLNANVPVSHSAHARSTSGQGNLGATGRQAPARKDANCAKMSSARSLATASASPVAANTSPHRLYACGTFPDRVVAGLSLKPVSA